MIARTPSPERGRNNNTTNKRPLLPPLSELALPPHKKTCTDRIDKPKNKSSKLEPPNQLVDTKNDSSPAIMDVWDLFTELQNAPFYAGRYRVTCTGDLGSLFFYDRKDRKCTKPQLFRGARITFQYETKDNIHTLLFTKNTFHKICNLFQQVNQCHGNTPQEKLEYFSRLPKLNEEQKQELTKEVSPPCSMSIVSPLPVDIQDSPNIVDFLVIPPSRNCKLFQLISGQLHEIQSVSSARGICILPDGYVVALDDKSLLHNNTPTKQMMRCNIPEFDASNDPIDICYINENTFIVSLCDSQQIISLTIDEHGLCSSIQSDNSFNSLGLWYPTGVTYFNGITYYCSTNSIYQKIDGRVSLFCELPGAKRCNCIIVTNQLVFVLDSPLSSIWIISENSNPFCLPLALSNPQGMCLETAQSDYVSLLVADSGNQRIVQVVICPTTVSGQKTYNTTAKIFCSLENLRYCPIKIASRPGRSNQFVISAHPYDTFKNKDRNERRTEKKDVGNKNDASGRESNFPSLFQYGLVNPANPSESRVTFFKESLINPYNSDKRNQAIKFLKQMYQFLCNPQNVPNISHRKKLCNYLLTLTSPNFKCPVVIQSPPIKAGTIVGWKPSITHKTRLGVAANHNVNENAQVINLWGQLLVLMKEKQMYDPNLTYVISSSDIPGKGKLVKINDITDDTNIVGLFDPKIGFLTNKKDLPSNYQLTYSIGDIYCAVTLPPIEKEHVEALLLLTQCSIYEGKPRIATVTTDNKYCTNIEELIKNSQENQQMYVYFY